MKIDDLTGDLTLSSGRVIRANRGIVGIGPDLRISEGYDGGIDDEDFTPEECAELADLMIARWSEFKALAGPLR